jgi:carboxyl-terminal processing protease
MPGSAAEEAGLRSRDRIVAVNGDPCVRIGEVRGPVGTTVELRAVSPGEEPRDLVVERRQVILDILPTTGRVGADPTVGYLRLAALAGEPALVASLEALASFSDAGDVDGIVLDVRGTALGAPGVVVGVLAQFVDGNVGTLYTRDQGAPFIIEPGELRSKLTDMPVAVLVDESTEGEAEELAGVLQAEGRAVVVGKQTLGRSHGVRELPFPDGSLLRLVTTGLELSDGTRIAGRGIVPDVSVEADWLAFPESADPFLLQALVVLEARRTA